MLNPSLKLNVVSTFSTLKFGVLLKHSPWFADVHSRFFVCFLSKNKRQMKKFLSNYEKKGKLFGKRLMWISWSKSCKKFQQNLDKKFKKWKEFWTTKRLASSDAAEKELIKWFWQHFTPKKSSEFGKKTRFEHNCLW